MSHAEGFDSVVTPIQAIIPSSTSVEVIMEHGDFPRAPHRTGEGTHEDTLRQLGLRIIGIALTPHHAMTRGDAFVYLTDPIDPSTVSLTEGACWVGVPYDPRLEAFARQWRFSINHLNWRLADRD